MSFYEDYVAEGSHCMCCGVFIGDDCGYPRECSHCAPPVKRTKTQRNNARKRRKRKEQKANERGATQKN